LKTFIVDPPGRVEIDAAGKNLGFIRWRAGQILYLRDDRADRRQLLGRKARVPGASDSMEGAKGLKIAGRARAIRIT
jgi:hypothetical protein